MTRYVLSAVSVNASDDVVCRTVGLSHRVTVYFPGTVTSVLVPWNTCGATQSSVLGVSTWTYAPYCFFNIISPFMSIFMAAVKYKIRRYTPEELARVQLEADKADRELYAEEES